MFSVSEQSVNKPVSHYTTDILRFFLLNRLKSLNGGEKAIASISVESHGTEGMTPWHALKGCLRSRGKWI